MQGYEFEASVLPNIIAINCTPHASYRDSDLEICKKIKKWHIYAREKRGEETDFDDDVEEYEDFLYGLLGHTSWQDVPAG